MTADLTRRTFRPRKNYSSVVQQQGRVQLDADWNEQSSIMQHYLRSLARDVFGPHGGPAPPDLGFGIVPLSALGLAPPAADFAITQGYANGEGHYYVDGILCEQEKTWVPITILANNQVQIAHIELDGSPLLKDQYVMLFGVAALPETAFARIESVDYPQQIPTLTLSGIGKLTNNFKPHMRRLTTYLTQRDFTSTPLTTGNFHVYLDVWERLITYVEDDTIREVALNGPDTSARTRIVWQVKTIPASNNECLQPDLLTGQLFPLDRGLLRARARPTPASQDPCTIAPDSAYRGPENQLYRVEVHSGGVLPAPNVRIAQPPTFKWSRENGSVVFPIVSGGSTNTLVLETLGRDDRYGLIEGDWVEIVDDASVLQGRVEPLLQVKSIDRGRRSVVLAGTPATNVGNDPSKHPLLRRWDQKAGDPSKGGLTLSQHDNAAQISGPDAWVELENGVQIQFADPGANFRSGDYWLIPARVANGDVDWRTETIPVDANTTVRQPVARPPDGVEHHYAPLAILNILGNTVTVARDCRRALAPAAPLPPAGTVQVTLAGQPTAARARRRPRKAADAPAAKS